LSFLFFIAFVVVVDVVVSPQVACFNNLATFSASSFGVVSGHLSV